MYVLWCIFYERMFVYLEIFVLYLYTCFYYIYIYIYVYNACYGMKYTFILIICFPQTKCVYINFPHELGWITICILSCIFLQLFTLVIWIICSHRVFYHFICIYLPSYSRVIILMAYRCASATVIDLYTFVCNYVYMYGWITKCTYLWYKARIYLYLYICS